MDESPTNGTGLAPAEQREQGQVEVRRADPNSITAHWGFLRKGLEQIRQHSLKRGNKVYWLPEHVAFAVVQNRAELWWVLEDEVIVAFVVTQFATDPFVQVPLGLFIWQAWAQPGHNVVELTDAFLSEYALANRCLYMDAYTARPGLPRRLGKLGWRATMSVIRKELVP